MKLYSSPAADPENDRLHCPYAANKCSAYWHIFHTFSSQHKKGMLQNAGFTQYLVAIFPFSYNAKNQTLSLN